MFRYTKRVWPTVEKKKEEKEKKSLSKFPNGRESLSEGGRQPWDHQAAPTSNIHIHSPVCPPLLDSSSFYLQHLTQNLHFPTKQYKNTKKKTLQRSERRPNFLEPSTSKPPNLRTKNLPVKVQTQKNKQKKRLSGRSSQSQDAL